MVDLTNCYVRTNSDLTKKYIVKLMDKQLASRFGSKYMDYKRKDKQCQNTAS